MARVHGNGAIAVPIPAPKKRNWNKLIPIIITACLIGSLVGSYFAFWQNTGVTNPPPAQDGIVSPVTPTEPEIDSDGDGFSDWFEENIAHYDPTIPNDRYVIFYYRMLEDPGLVPYVIDEPTKFFIEEGKVPPENIIGLAQEGANAVTLENAINRAAEKSDKNDLVFLRILAHGSYEGFDGGVQYTVLDEWLDKIEAKAVIVVIMACGCELALPRLKDGPCPRIIFVHSAGEFIGALGADDEYFTAADTKYGDGNGYIAVGEIGNWIDNDPMWGSDWGELHENGRGHFEAYGYSKMSDTSNVAYEIYFTDYKIPS